jgi:cell division initiation protein
MNVTPLDLRHQHFRTVMRGFDKTEVIAFLVEAADDYEAALHDADRLRQDVARLEGQLAEHQEHERNLRNTLLTAQRLADGLEESAQQQAAAVVKDAEARAHLLIEKAQARLEDVQRDIDTLGMRRRDAETAVEAVVASLRNSLEFMREQDTREHDDRVDNVVIHRPRHIDVRETQAGWGQTRGHAEPASS